MTTLQTNILLLCSAYVMLSVVLLAILTQVTMPRLWKIAAILVASSFYLVVFFATQGLLGWSSPTAVPPRFKVLWTRIVEPNPAQQQPGAVHLWLEALDDANLPSGVPRAYLLPYSSQLASRVAVAQTEIEKGHPQGGRAQSFGMPSSEGNIAGPLDTSAPPGGDPSGGGILDPSFLGGQSKTVDLIPLPKPVLPEKELQ